jgi:anhydro-N-acetylmuramic acid kinase
MIYRVIGLMSGSSLDGLDIVYANITNVGQEWDYEIEHAVTIPFDMAWKKRLQNFNEHSIAEFLQLHTAFGRYIGNEVNKFIDTYSLHHKVHFIASHGHTVYHNPSENTTFQIGDGASIAAVTGLTTISDLRSIDVAYGGQGAPIVPIADQMLFKAYKYCLNIGGIANISIKTASGIAAFDVCAANQVLNFFVQQKGMDYDDKGQLASIGQYDDHVIQTLHDIPFFQQKGAKSLNNDFAKEYIIPKLNHLEVENALHTACKHIAYEIKAAILAYIPLESEQSELLVTGGGAHNDFLIQCIQEALQPLNITVVKSQDTIIDFKEALAMALIGVLRWREENNTLSSVTGATKDSIGGALWLAQ